MAGRTGTSVRRAALLVVFGLGPYHRRCASQAERKRGNQQEFHGEPSYAK